VRKGGFSRAAVSAWVTGSRLPDPPSIDRIADALGLDVDTVLTIAGHRPKTEDIDPDSPKGRILSMAQRIDWTADGRERIVTLMFRDFIEQDRERKRQG
jgi:hypothetical protein